MPHLSQNCIISLKLQILLSDSTILVLHYSAAGKSGAQAAAALANLDIENSDEFDTDLESGEEVSSDEEQPEKRKAPNELMMEVHWTLTSAKFNS